jgi:methylglutaconyl-CoA hydratase
MYRIYSHPRPTIARVNGPAIGGGNGLVAACDIAIASEGAIFSLSEVRIGIVPACIAPYVIRRLGEAKARELMLTGERFDAARAAALGFVNQAVGERQLDSAVDEKVEHILRCGPEALKVCKELIEKVPQMSLEDAKPYTAEVIARLRVSDEGQEGMSAFLNKRLPAWAQKKGGES